MTTAPHSLQGRSHAVVIGASVTGLSTARVLADHFERVTVLDQDALPDSPVPRRGVPQASHVHNLMARGCQIFERLFPGLIAELESHGALTFDYGENTRILFQGQLLPRFRSGVRSVASSRALLEWCLQGRLRALPQLTVRTGTSVSRLQGERGGRIRGVVLKEGASTDTEQVLEADLVVDASGRGSHAPQWLQALGRALPPEQLIRPGLAYATRWYRVPPNRQVERLGDWVIIGTSPEFPARPYSGAVCRVEGEQMIVTLLGAGNHPMPTDDTDFLALARELPLPAIAELIQDAEPLSPIHTFRGARNRWRHYERVAHWPEGFVVLGDAACVFNPAYGQGMTVAGLSALLLDACLREDGAGMCHTFQKRLAELHQVPWGMVRGDDTLWELGDKATWVQRLTSQVQRQLVGSLFFSEAGTRRFLEVMHMLRTPESMLDREGLVQVGRGVVNRLARRLPPSLRPAWL
ncbi:FAD-dependent oxidoreductase [Cystobacter fuscus]|uniref:FAD-dependent oxidoreductase n=1 Tax=Cystobacter fuscus TaxID=43 RepID=UPI0012DE0E1E|nr:2-polyprenyl-6-methoxyphenol hydroxylase-like oxidoreductase [Cystobacter fuscus]